MRPEDAGTTAPQVRPAGPQCVLLAGGLGTRLGALAEATPKPLLPVAGRPFLDHLIDEIARFGIDRFVILAGHLGERIVRHYAGRRTARGRPLTVEVVVEPHPLGTAGGLALFANRLDDTFLLFNADTFFDFNLSDFLQPPLAGDVLMRMAVRPEADAARFGTVELVGAPGNAGSPEHGSARVVGFREKARRAESGLVNAGAYLMRKEVVAVIGRPPCSMELDVMPKLAKRGALEARAYEGSFIDIGVPEEFDRAQHLFPIARPAVFFDRDGVLNEDSGYTHRTADLRWLPGAREAVRAVNDSGRFAFVITNQSGVARGYYDEAAVTAFHSEMQRQLAEIGAHIDAFVFCPHHPGGTVDPYVLACDCRKPAPGMIRHLLRTWPVRSADSVVIGDRDSDLAAAAAAGLRARRYDGGDLRALVR